MASLNVSTSTLLPSAKRAGELRGGGEGWGWGSALICGGHQLMTKVAASLARLCINMNYPPDPRQCEV